MVLDKRNAYVGQWGRSCTVHMQLGMRVKPYLEKSTYFYGAWLYWVHCMELHMLEINNRGEN